MPQYGGMEWKWYVYLIHIILKSSSSVSEEKKMAYNYEFVSKML